MIVGKTSTSISISELFEKYSEVSILTAVFPEINCIPCKISSPFRSDSNPSFSIYLDDNKHIRFKDFGDPECRGGLLDLLCRKWKCSFCQVFDKILEVMRKQEGSDVTIKPKHVRLMTRKESSELTKIQVAVRSWRQYDLDYWQSYGITKPWLKHAEIYPISHKVVTKKDKETVPTASVSTKMKPYPSKSISLSIPRGSNGAARWMPVLSLYGLKYLNMAIEL